MAARQITCTIISKISKQFSNEHYLRYFFQNETLNTFKRNLLFFDMQFRPEVCHGELSLIKC